MVQSSPTSAADGGAGMDLDAGDDAGQVGNKPSQPFHAAHPAPVRPAVHDDRLQAGVTGQHLPGVAGRGIAFDDAVDVLAQMVEHG
jgi:hypothetical protein